MLQRGLRKEIKMRVAQRNVTCESEAALATLAASVFSRATLPAVSIGQVFGQLTIEQDASAPSDPAYICSCTCGATKRVNKYSLLAGTTKSCGCSKATHLRRICTTHGMTKSPEFRTWRGIIARCHNSNVPCYSRYGGAGVRVCEQWRASFESFYAHIGPKPGPSFSIDRIDNSRGYEPGNVRWATIHQQARNVGRNVWLEYDGRRMVLSDWAAAVGLTRSALETRIKNGWPVEAALTLPNGYRYKSTNGWTGAFRLGQRKAARP